LIRGWAINYSLIISAIENIFEFLKREFHCKYFMFYELRYPALPGLICSLLSIFVLQVLEFQAPQAQGWKGGQGKPASKPFLDR